MENTKDPSEQSLIQTISPDCELIRNQIELKIVISFSENTSTYKNLIFISLTFFLFFIIFVWFNLVIQGVMYLIFLILIMTPCLSGYSYYKNKRNEWFFDKSQATVVLTKRFKHFTRIKTFSFSEISSLLYHRDHKYIDPYHYNVSLRFNQNRIQKIYIGEKEECRILGSVISSHISIPLQFEPQTKILNSP